MVSHSDPGTPWAASVFRSLVWCGWLPSGRQETVSSPGVSPHQPAGRPAHLSFPARRPRPPTPVSLPPYFWLCFPRLAFLPGPSSLTALVWEAQALLSAPDLQMSGREPTDTPILHSAVLAVSSICSREILAHVHAHTYGRTRMHITIVLEIVRKGKPCPLPSAVTPTLAQLWP